LLDCALGELIILLSTLYLAYVNTYLLYTKCTVFGSHHYRAAKL